MFDLCKYIKNTYNLLVSSGVAFFEIFNLLGFLMNYRRVMIINGFLYFVFLPIINPIPKGIRTMSNSLINPTVPSHSSVISIILYFVS